MAAPLHTDLMDVTPQVIKEWVDAGLVIRYNGDRTPVLFFPAFQRNQIGMRYDHETPSAFPPPPGYYRERTGLQLLDGQLTDIVRTSSGDCPPELEVKDQDQDQDQGQGRAATPPPAPPPAPPAAPPSVEVALDGGTITAKPDQTTPKAMSEKPAIVAYHDVFQRFPSKAQMVQLLQHGISDLPLWDRVLTTRLNAGYNPLNIGGMFDWYDHPELIPVSGSQRSAVPAGKARALSKVELSMRAIDEIEEMLAKGGTL
jgi:hypothetical protein